MVNLSACSETVDSMAVIVLSSSKLKDANAKDAFKGFVPKKGRFQFYSSMQATVTEKIVINMVRNILLENAKLHSESMLHRNVLNFDR